MAGLFGKLGKAYEIVENKLYQEVFKEDLEFDVLTLDNLKAFFYTEKLNYPGAESTIFSVSPSQNEPGKFEVQQLLLDHLEMPIKKTENSYVGRAIVVRDIDKAVLDLMQGKQTAIIK